MTDIKIWNIIYLSQTKQRKGTNKRQLNTGDHMGYEYIVEILGWMAAAFVVASYAYKNVRSMRVVNSVASLLFAIYGVLIGAPSIIVLNVTLVAVNMAYIFSDGKFGEVITRYKKASALAFAVYSASILGWVFATSGSNFVEIIGIVSSIGFIAGFMLPNEKEMRTVCCVAVALNIVYAIMIGSTQIVFTNSLSLIVNIVRLFMIMRDANRLAASRSVKASGGSLFVKGQIRDNARI